MPSHDNFEIDIISALSAQLVSAFVKLDVGPLSLVEIDSLPDGQGVYQLYHHGSLVYVGKADDLPSRLCQHRRKITGRRNISADDMGYNCLYVHPNWTALAPEASLINHYRRHGTGECRWNGNGFGPHDPGREREETDKPPDGFDAQYPIRDDWRCDWIKAGEHNAAELIGSLKDGLPYLLRYQTVKKKSHKPHADYKDTTVTVPEDDMAAKDLLRIVAQALPGWQATMFSSHMILYKEHRTYKHGQVIWPV
ncbi:MAG: GIY-YIG nuclease family protein [Acidobacteria bacterium]|nr:GIY-YIG nuclease family protein [Acidobacteriota bacterium]